MSDHLDLAKKTIAQHYNPGHDQKVGVATAHALIAIAELLERMIDPNFEDRVRFMVDQFKATELAMGSEEIKGPDWAGKGEVGLPSEARWEEELEIEDIYKVERDLMSEAEFKRQYTCEPAPEDICRICRSIENEHDLFHAHKFASYYNIPGGESNLSGSGTYDGI